MKEKISYEEALVRLEEIIQLLNSNEMSLDESLKLYTESAKLLSFCNKTLENAKLKIEEIFPQFEENLEVGHEQI